MRSSKPFAAHTLAKHTPNIDARARARVCMCACAAMRVVWLDASRRSARIFTRHGVRNKKKHGSHSSRSLLARSQTHFRLHFLFNTTEEIQVKKQKKLLNVNKRANAGKTFAKYNGDRSACSHTAQIARVLYGIFFLHQQIAHINESAK